MQNERKPRFTSVNPGLRSQHGVYDRKPGFTIATWGFYSRNLGFTIVNPIVNLGLRSISRVYDRNMELWHLEIVQNLWGTRAGFKNRGAKSFFDS